MSKVKESCRRQHDSSQQYQEMIYKEFDTIIDTIENSVIVPWEKIERKLKKDLAMTSQQIGDLFKYFYPHDITVNRYYKERKAFRTMEAIVNSAGESMDDVIARFGYSDYSVFYKTIRKITGKNPQQIVESGDFCVPSVIHLEDALKGIDYDFDNQVRSRTDLDEYRSEQAALVDRITFRRDFISELRRQFRNSKDSFERASLEKEINRLEENVAKDEQTLASYKHEPVYIKNLTAGLYAEFVKIEDCRAIYGLSIGKIVELYNDSVKTGIPLSFLCDITSDNEFFDEPDDEMLEQEFEDEWEAHQQYLEDNMSLAESWQYYNDDDAEDPYAGIEEPEEYYY